VAMGLPNVSPYFDQPTSHPHNACSPLRIHRGSYWLIGEGHGAGILRRARTFGYFYVLGLAFPHRDSYPEPSVQHDCLLAMLANHCAFVRGRVANLTGRLRWADLR
jgi:hypothetical protein